MDMLKPPIISIGNRRYRKNPVELAGAEDFRSNTNAIFVDDDPHDSGNLEDCYDETPNQVETLNIKETAAGFSLSLGIPSVYFKYIVGKNGDKKKQLETETKTQIYIPGIKEEGFVVISGRERCQIVSAKTRIDLIVSSQRRRLAPTHFLAFPLNYEDIQRNFDNFKANVLSDCSGDRGIDETLFQKSSKFHLTLGVMVLNDKSEVDEASNLLKTCSEECIKECVAESISIRVQGLEYMNDDPSEVNVLYAKVICLDDPSLLQSLSDQIVRRFTSAGIMTDEHERVKLHMTVMNSLFRSDLQTASDYSRESRDCKTGRDRLSFDATNILQMYGDYNFGDCRLTSLDICVRHSSVGNAYYKILASVPISSDTAT